MAEAAQGVPTFKLVLVGDGGTGKVQLTPWTFCASSRDLEILRALRLTVSIDYFRQAPLDW